MEPMKPPVKPLFPGEGRSLNKVESKSAKEVGHKQNLSYLNGKINGKNITLMEQHVAVKNTELFADLLLLLDTNPDALNLVGKSQDFAPRVLVLLAKTSEDNTVKRELIDSVMKKFSDIHVSQYISSEKNVDIVCKGRQHVMTNTDTLRLSGEKLNKILSTNMKDITKYGQGKTRLEFKENTKEAVERFLEMSVGKEHHRILTPEEYEAEIKVLAEVFIFADSSLNNNVKEKAYAQLLEIINKIDVNSTISLQNIYNSVELAKLPDDKALEIQMNVLKKFLKNANIDFMHLPGSGDFLISANALGLMVDENKGILSNLLNQYVTGALFPANFNIKSLPNLSMLPVDIRNKIHMFSSVNSLSSTQLKQLVKLFPGLNSAAENGENNQATLSIKDYDIYKELKQFITINGPTPNISVPKAQKESITIHLDSLEDLDWVVSQYPINFLNSEGQVLSNEIVIKLHSLDEKKALLRLSLSGLFSNYLFDSPYGNLIGELKFDFINCKGEGFAGIGRICANPNDGDEEYFGYCRDHRGQACIIKKPNQDFSLFYIHNNKEGQSELKEISLNIQSVPGLILFPTRPELEPMTYNELEILLMERIGPSGYKDIFL